MSVTRSFTKLRCLFCPCGASGVGSTLPGPQVLSSEEGTFLLGTWDGSCKRISLSSVRDLWQEPQVLLEKRLPLVCIFCVHKLSPSKPFLSLFFGN